MRESKIDFRLNRRIDFRSFLVCAISGALLWLTFYSSGLHIANIRLTGNQWNYFVGAVITFVIATWVQSIRANLLWTDDLKGGRKKDTYPSILIGNFYNSILPGNLGDGVRSWHFSKKQRTPFTASVAAVLTEKWIDAQVFVLVNMVMYSLVLFANPYIFLAVCYTSLFILVTLVVYVLMLKFRPLEKAVWLFLLRFKRPGRFLFRVYKHVSWQLLSLARSGLMFYYFLLCLLILALNMLQFFLLFNAAGISGPLVAVSTAYYCAIGMMLIAIIPAAPGNVGVLHYGIYSVLVLCAQKFGIQAGSAELQSYALFSVYLHLSYVIPDVIMGSVMVVKERRFLIGLNVPLREVA